MENNQYRIGKITTSQKLPDRFLSIKIHKPTEDQKEYGTLYFLIEITTPWFPASEIGKEIEKSVINNFYGGKNYENTEVRFEDSIKKTNLLLADWARKGETNWVGNLNAIIAAISKEKIFITNSGNMEAFLLRKNSLQNICEKDENPHSPVSTFSNIISGTLENSDKLLFFNSELLKHFNQDQIKAILQNFDPISGIHEMAKILRKNKIVNVNSLFIESISKDKTAFQPPPELPDTVFLDQREDLWIEKAFKKTKPALSGATEKAKTQLASTREKTAPILKRFTIAVGKFIIAIGSLIKSLTGNITKSRREKARDRIRSGKAKDWDEFIEKPAQRSFFQTISSGFSAFIAFLVKYKKLVIILLLIVVLIWGINLIRKSVSEPKINVSKIIQEAEAKEKEAKSQLAINNKDSARTNFIDALKILDPAMNSDQKSKVESVYNRIQGEFDEMDNIKRWGESEAVFNFSANDSSAQVSQILLVDKNFYAVNKQNNKIYKISESDFSVQATAQISTQEGQIQTLVATSDSIIWKTNSRNIFAQSLKTNNIEKQKLSSSDEWKNASKISYYSNSLYFLTSLENQIYKYTRGSSGWSEPKESIDNSKINISKAISIAIDGYIYVLNSDGTCIKFSRGKTVSGFAIKDIPIPAEKIEEPLSILTSSEMNSLYILDAKLKRIIEIDKEGNYKGQYYLPSNIDDVRDFALNLKTRKIYVLSDNFIYQFGL